MLIKLALVLLLAWAIGALGFYEIGQAVHVVLLVGLMFLFLGLLKARDAAAVATPAPNEPVRKR